MLTTEISAQSDVRQSLIQEIGQTSDYTILSEVLDFLLFVREKHSQQHLNINSDEDYEDIADAKAALASIDSDGTISWQSLKAEIGL